MNVLREQNHTIAQNPAGAKPAREVTHMSFGPAKTLGQLGGRGDVGQGHVLRSSTINPFLVIRHFLHPAAIKQKPGLLLRIACARTYV